MPHYLDGISDNSNAEPVKNSGKKKITDRWALLIQMISNIRRSA